MILILIKIKVYNVDKYVIFQESSLKSQYFLVKPAGICTLMVLLEVIILFDVF